MTASLTTILLRDMYSERSDALLVELGADGALRVPQSADVVAHYVLEGSVVITVDDEEPVTLTKGEYGFLFFGNAHRISVEHEIATREHVVSGWPVSEEPKVLRIGGNPAARFISSALRLAHSVTATRSLHTIPELLPFKYVAESSLMHTAQLTDADQVYADCHGPGANAMINALMNLHLVRALRCGYADAHRSFPLQVGAQNWRHITAAVRFLRTHPEENWTVSRLAQKVGLSRSRFAAHFRADVGVGPMQFLYRIRMEKAAELLQENSDISFAVIGRQVGYETTSSFARAFKAYHGMSPKSFSQQSGVKKTGLE